MNITGYYLTKGITACSDGTYIIGDDIKEHMALLCKYPYPDINAFWHMDYAAALILRLLKVNKEQAQALYKSTDLTLSRYALKYRSSKLFSIRNGTQFRAPLSVFCDMSQFNECTFKLNETVDECMTRAKEAQKLAQQTYDAASKLNIEPNTLISPISIFEKKYLGKFDAKGNPKPLGVDIPTVLDYPEEFREDLAHAAYECVHGGWVESFVKGHYPNSADYDISSAYSFYESELLDTRQGTFMRSKEYDPQATYGLALCDLRMTSNFHPILYNTDVQNHYTPFGKYPKPTWRHKQELDIIKEFQLGEVLKIHDGFWWRCKRPYKPLQYLIKWLWNMKSQSEGFDKEFTKRVLNGMWGIMLQIKKGNEIGEHFNPLGGSIVETQCRLDVFRFCMRAMKEGRKILHIAVDGNITDEPVSFVDRTKEKLPGQWRLEANCPSLIISSGCVAIRDKLGKGEFGMDYDWLVDQIKKNPEQVEYPETKLSPMTLAVCINENKYDKIGDIDTLTKTIDIDSDIKRGYPRNPKNGGELLNNRYDSVPIDVGSLIKQSLSVG